MKLLVNDLGLSERVIFTGRVPDEDIHFLYSVADFIVFPYLYGFEGPSGPLAFAIQHRLPIIGNNIGHLSNEIRSMREGILVPPKDPQALTKAMTLIADNDDLRHTFAENLKMKSNGALWQDVASKTCDLYNQLLAS
jgi:glycosyltransferase involved in cell wall biosynthesis